jgi:hypothetical protein
MAGTHARNYVAHFPEHVKNVLVVANDMQDCSALAAALAEMHAREAVRIYLLAVVIPPTGHARSFLRAIDLKRSLHQHGQRALRPLRDLLDAAQVPYQHHVEVGQWLAAISEFAQARGCRRILIGDNQGSAMRDLVLRHDRWKIESCIEKAGLACAVVQLDEAAARPPAGFGEAAQDRQ